ncbi:MAG: DUF362 domain-containing protein [Syntrophobacteria bacterium]
MKRRTFLKKLLAATAVALGLDGVAIFDLVPRAGAGPGKGPLLTAATNQDYSQLVTEVMKALGGMKHFVTEGNRVVVKPNMSWDRRPEYGANTHPLVLKRVVELCLEAEAKEVTVMDRPCNDPWRSYRASGIPEAVESIGSSRAKVKHLNRRRFVEMDMPDAVALKHWEFYRDALEADTLITVSPAKQHNSARLSLGMKNIMGLVGGRRERLHVGDLHQHIADLNTVLQADLTIIDATRQLLANGPSGGNVDDVRVMHHLAASVDPVAADAYAATLFDLKGEDIGYIRYGYEMGFGEIDLNKVHVVQV